MRDETPPGGSTPPAPCRSSGSSTTQWTSISTFRSSPPSRTPRSSPPGSSEELGAWLHADGDHLRFSDDRAGSRFWLTAVERERSEKERERALREAAERRIAELEAKLREQG